MGLFKKIFQRKEESQVVELKESQLSDWINRIEILDIDVVEKLCKEIEDQIREVRSRLYDLKMAKTKEKVDKRLFKRIEQSRYLLIQTIEISINKITSLESFGYDDVFRYYSTLLQTMLAMTELSEKHSFLIIQLYKEEMQKLNREMLKLGHLIDELGKLLKEKEKKAKSIRDAQTLLNDLADVTEKISGTNSKIEEKKNEISKLEEEIRRKITKEKELKESKDVKIALQRKNSLESLEKELQNLESEIVNHLSFLKKPLKKYEYLAEKGNLSVSKENMKFLSNFQRDPLKTLLSNRNNLRTLNKILGEIAVLMKKGKITIKGDKRREKTIIQVEKLIESDFIPTKLSEHKKLSSMMKEKMKEDSLDVLKNLEKMKSKIHTLESKLIEEKEKLEELEKIKVQLENNRYETKRNLESIISDILNNRVRIRDD